MHVKFSPTYLYEFNIHNFQAFLSQIVRLKSLLVNEERAKESAKAKARKFEDELMIERRRCTEFSTLFERAKKVFLLSLIKFFNY